MAVDSSSSEVDSREGLKRSWRFSRKRVSVCEEFGRVYVTNALHPQNMFSDGENRVSLCVTVQ